MDLKIIYFILGVCSILLGWSAAKDKRGDSARRKENIIDGVGMILIGLLLFLLAFLL